jgi:hypothetical protein
LIGEQEKHRFLTKWRSTKVKKTTFFIAVFLIAVTAVFAQTEDDFEVTLTEDGEGAFNSCSSLASVTLPQSLTKIGSFAFSGSAITSIILPPNLTTIEGGTFANCQKLTSIVIPEGVTVIGDAYDAYNYKSYGTFSDCTALTSATLPSIIQKIGSRAFFGCSVLTTITIPETVKNIEFGEDTFRACKKLALVLQARLKRLGYTGEFLNL